MPACIDLFCFLGILASTEFCVTKARLLQLPRVNSRQARSIFNLLKHEIRDLMCRARKTTDIIWRERDENTSPLVKNFCPPA